MGTYHTSQKIRDRRATGIDELMDLVEDIVWLDEQYYQLPLLEKIWYKHIKNIKYKKLNDCVLIEECYEIKNCAYESVRCKDYMDFYKLLYN